MPKPTLAEIAEKIDRHLERGKIPAYVTARWDHVWIKYWDRDEPYAMLTLAQARRYLTWLDAGGVGKHWEALR